MATPTTSIDNLPAATAVVGTQLLVVHENGVTKKATVDAHLAYINGNLVITLTAADIAAAADPNVAGTTVQAQLTDLIARVTALEP